MTETDRTLYSGFLRSADLFPSHCALIVGAESLTYEELGREALNYAATLQQRLPQPDPPLTAVFAYRSPAAFAGVLGALLSGSGYVPLNRTHPPERSATVLRQAGCRSAIVDSESAEQLDVVLRDVEHPMLLIFPDLEDASEFAGRWPLHRVVAKGEMANADDWRDPEVSPDAVAYILFTSGSTGTPKGVMTSHRNVATFLDVVVERYGFNETDRFSALADPTFDATVFDTFSAWEVGGCVCCPSQKAHMNPGRFLSRSEVTFVHMVPTALGFMKRMRMLKPGKYPKIRLSVFAGEPLTVEAARAWAAAAPNSVIENLYGTTESTVDSFVHPWTPGDSEGQEGTDIIPIGRPYPGVDAIVVDDGLLEVEPGCEGELLLGGEQVGLGYFKMPEENEKKFIVPPGKTLRYYRTGDRVRRPAGEGPFVHLGRFDHQIKVRGNRVELGEVEAAIRQELGEAEVVAVGWPEIPGGANGVVAFIGNEEADVKALAARLEARLPSYMAPTEIIPLSRIPLNAHGKYDRRALKKILEES